MNKGGITLRQLDCMLVYSYTVIMKKVTIYLDEDNYLWLRKHVVDKKTNVSRLISEWLSLYRVKKEDIPQGKFITEYKDRIPMSKETEEMLLNPSPTPTTVEEPTIEELRQIQKEAEERYTKNKLVEETRESVE